MTDNEFDYILDRIGTAQFQSHPFKHLLIENFLSEEHLTHVTTAPQVALSPATSTKALIDNFKHAGYVAQPFPGCTTDVADYLRRLKNNDWPVDKAKLEGYGMAWRLGRFDDPLLTRLLAFFNGPAFKAAIESKFGITRPNRIETAIQKYLSGYEISPHPDIRSKCITYLLNINTTPEADTLPLHTHLLAFKPRWRFIYDFWETIRNTTGAGCHGTGVRVKKPSRPTTVS